MTSIVFSLLAATLIFLVGFASFSSSTFMIFKKDFSRQAAERSGEACLAYGDLLTRTKTLTAGSGTKSVEYPLGCIQADPAGCSYKMSCKITVTNANKINISLH